MLKIRFNNEKIYFSQNKEPWVIHPMTEQWLWMMECLKEGETVSIWDDRKNLSPEEERMSFDYDAATGDIETRKSK